MRLEIDEAVFAGAFGRRSIAVGHALSEHPLFTLDAIAALSDRLPTASVRCEGGQLAFVNSQGYVDIGEDSPGQSIRNIESNGFRITLRDIHRDPEYAAVIDECLDEVDPLVADREGGMLDRAGYLFISSPAAKTPMHFDVEHNFLL